MGLYQTAKSELIKKRFTLFLALGPISTGHRPKLNLEHSFCPIGPNPMAGFQDNWWFVADRITE